MRAEMISLQPLASGRMVGIRAKAVPIRHQVEAAVAQGQDVVISFAGVDATQSFVDELLGVLILKHGPDILEKLVFQSCSENVRAIVEFVAADRADQFRKIKTH